MDWGIKSAKHVKEMLEEYIEEVSNDDGSIRNDQIVINTELVQEMVKALSNVKTKKRTLKVEV